MSIKRFNESLNPTQKRYAVMRNGAQIGVVMGNNYSHANTKALQMFKRHVYVERLT